MQTYPDVVTQPAACTAQSLFRNGAQPLISGCLQVAAITSRILALKSMLGSREGLDLVWMLEREPRCASVAVLQTSSASSHYDMAGSCCRTEKGTDQRTQSSMSAAHRMRAGLICRDALCDDQPQKAQVLPVHRLLVASMNQMYMQLMSLRVSFHYQPALHGASS